MMMMILSKRNSFYFINTIKNYYFTVCLNIYQMKEARRVVRERTQIMAAEFVNLLSPCTL